MRRWAGEYHIPIWKRWPGSRTWFIHYTGTIIEGCTCITTANPRLKIQTSWAREHWEMPWHSAGDRRNSRTVNQVDHIGWAKSRLHGALWTTGLFMRTFLSPFEISLNCYTYTNIITHALLPRVLQSNRSGYWDYGVYHGFHWSRVVMAMVTHANAT